MNLTHCLRVILPIRTQQNMQGTGSNRDFSIYDEPVVLPTYYECGRASSSSTFIDIYMYIFVRRIT